MVPGMTTNCRDALPSTSDTRITCERLRLKQGLTKITSPLSPRLGYDAPQLCLDLSVASTARARREQIPEEICDGHPLRGAASAGWTSIRASSNIRTGRRLRARDAQIGKDVVDDFAYTGSPAGGIRWNLGVDKDAVCICCPQSRRCPGVSGWKLGLDPKTLKGIGHLSGDARGAKGYSTYSLNWLPITELLCCP